MSYDDNAHTFSVVETGLAGVFRPSKQVSRSPQPQGYLLRQIGLSCPLDLLLGRDSGLKTPF